MNDLSKSVLDSYFHSHRELVDVDDVDANSVIVSFPIYFSGNHRVELSVTKSPSGFLISDMGRTIGELRLAGMAVVGRMKERLTKLAKNANVRFVGNNMVRECTPDQLGDVLHLFADSAKTIGDVYLVHKAKIENEDELRGKVKEVLVKQSYAFREFEEIQGNTESHKVDFYIEPNGIPGLALSVLAKPTRLTAEAWAFKTSDIQKKHARLQVGLVYGTDAQDLSKEIISKNVTIAIPASDLAALEAGLVPLLSRGNGHGKNKKG